MQRNNLTNTHDTDAPVAAFRDRHTPNVIEERAGIAEVIFVTSFKYLLEGLVPS